MNPKTLARAWALYIASIACVVVLGLRSGCQGETERAPSTLEPRPPTRHPW